MTTREIIPFAKNQELNLTLSLPGSKSITNRAFLCAALAQGTSRISGALKSDDTTVMLSALRKLEILNSKLENGDIEIEGGKFTSKTIELDLHNAGTAVRFLTAVMCVRGGETVITGDKRMQERPIKDLVDGLKQIGAEIEYLGNEGYPPIRIQDSGFRIQKNSNKISMKGNQSSQYFSALLILGPLLSKGLTVEVEGDLVSKPYIDTTISVMKAFGVEVQNNNYQSFTVKPQAYKATDYTVEGDASAASYFTSLRHLHGGNLDFTNLDAKTSIQGDSKYPDALKKLGKDPADGASVINMNAMPDAAMTLAVTAPFADGETEITDVGNMRIKETDRLAALETELKKVGVDVGTTNNSIAIKGFRSQDSGFRTGKLNPESIIQNPIKTYNDHRIAMSFAVFGTMTPGITIENPDCTDKTYPEFWRDLERTYLSPISLGNKHLILTGMRGAGKTHYGKKIAALLSREFVDLDAEIEKAEGMPISQIVEQKGWEHFREIEKQVCTRFSGGEHKEPLVVATGGGVVLDENNMLHLKSNGVNVFIYADLQLLVSRIENSDRPSLTHHAEDTAAEVADLWKERRPLYLKYADIVWDDTGGDVIGGELGQIFA